MIGEDLTRMPIRDYREPHVIDCRKPPELYVYVVMGDTDHAGCIKPVKVSYGSCCPFLKADWGSDAEDNHILHEVRIPMKYARRGWFLLDLAYDAEGFDHGKSQWREFNKACRMKRVFPAKTDPNIVPGFPNDLLPKRVLEVAKKRDPKREEWVPVMPSQIERKLDGLIEGKGGKGKG